MKFCKAPNCDTPVFGKHYCRSHQHLREDFDSRSIVQKAVDKRKTEKQNTSLKNKVRSLHTPEMDSRTSLIQDLDRYCSLYVRIRDAVGYMHHCITTKQEVIDGNVKCYTCSTVKHYTLMQSGHFIARGNMSLRFNVKDNQRTQCEFCNCNLHGNLDVFAENLEAEQKGLVEMLQEQARSVEKTGTDELSQMLVDIRSKYNTIKQLLTNQPKLN